MIRGPWFVPREIPHGMLDTDEGTRFVKTERTSTG